MVALRGDSDGESRSCLRLGEMLFTVSCTVPNSNDPLLFYGSEDVTPHSRTCGSTYQGSGNVLIESVGALRFTALNIVSAGATIQMY